MIRLSNGHNLSFIIASGALGWDGTGWWWEKPLIKMKLIKPELFTIITKTVTPEPRKGWYFVAPFRGGVWNYMGLPNKGIEWWINKYLHKLNNNQPLILSIAPYGNLKDSWIEKIKRKECIKAIEINVSCPNVNKRKYSLNEIYNEYKKFDLPLIIKIGYIDTYSIDELSMFEGVSLNSFPVKYGAISGKCIQKYNWELMRKLRKEGLKVVASSIWEYKDIVEVIMYIGCQAVSFGSIHLLRPYAPTQYIKRWGCDFIGN